MLGSKAGLPRAALEAYRVEREGMPLNFIRKNLVDLFPKLHNSVFERMKKLRLGVQIAISISRHRQHFYVYINSGYYFY